MAQAHPAWHAQNMDDKESRGKVKFDLILKQVSTIFGLTLSGSLLWDPGEPIFPDFKLVGDRKRKEERQSDEIGGSDGKLQTGIILTRGRCNFDLLPRLRWLLLLLLCLPPPAQTDCRQCAAARATATSLGT